MTWEPILRTLSDDQISGNIYLRNTHSKLWKREGHGDFLPYVGSLNPDINDPTLLEFYDQLDSGIVPGFTTEFRLGYRPVGLNIDLDRILLVEDGKIKIKNEPVAQTDGSIVMTYPEDNFGVELGDKIVHIYKNVPKWQN